MLVSRHRIINLPTFPPLELPHALSEHHQYESVHLPGHMFFRNSVTITNLNGARAAERSVKTFSTGRKCSMCLLGPIMHTGKHRSFIKLKKETDIGCESTHLRIFSQLKHPFKALDIIRSHFRANLCSSQCLPSFRYPS